MAAVDVSEQIARDLQIKERTNSSQFQTTSSFKKSKDSGLRKRSSELPGIVKQESGSAIKNPTKNLLAEFEKDETLEPNSTVFMDQQPSSTNLAPNTTTESQQLPQSTKNTADLQVR